MSQSSLFDPGSPIPPKVRASDPHTSHAAALMDPGGRSTLRTRLLYVFFTNPTRGMTAWEMTCEMDVCFPLDKPHWQPSVDKRRQELVEQGWLEVWDDGIPLTRSSPKGGAMLVWRLTAAAKENGLPEALRKGDESASDSDPIAQ